MLRQLEEMRAEEVAEARAKIAAGAKLSEEVALSNAAQIALKMQGKHDEQAENARIAAYNREKDRREQAYNHEQQAIKQAKERETARCASGTRLGHRAPHTRAAHAFSSAPLTPLLSSLCYRLRAQQERMKDKQSELDELRAKRAQEEAERQYRRKEEAAAQRMASINVSLSEARVAQKLEKERRLMENALNEKAEFSRILKVQKEYEAIEAADRAKRAEAQHEFNLDLQAQIQMNAEIRKQMRMDFLTDGENKRAQMEQERMKLEAIKSHKLAQLASVGVPPKYTVDLQNKQFT